MKKLVLLSMAALLTLGVSAKVTSAMKAIQKPVTIQNAPVAVDQRTVPLKAAIAMPQTAVNSKSKAGAKVSLTADEGATTSAYYSRSLGGFFMGLSTDFHGISGYNMMTFYPAFTSVTHTAYIPEGTVPSWKYWVDMEEENAIDGGTENTLTFDLENDYVYAPELTAADSVFSWGYLKPGGPANFTRTGDDGVARTFLATNTDRSWTPNGNYQNPTQTSVNLTDVGTIYSDVDEGVSMLEGVAEFVSVDPNHPYVLNAIYPSVSCEEVGGTVTLTVYKALQNEQGIYAGWTDEVIVTAEAEIEPQEGVGQMLAFEDLLTADPETGLDVPIVVDYPILVVLSSSDGAQFCPTWLNHAENIPTERHAFLYWQDMDSETGEYEPVVTNANWGYNFADYPEDYDDSLTPDDPGYIEPVIRYATAWNWQYDIDYNYLYGEDDTFEAPVEGGTKEFNVTSYWSSGAWTIETADGDELPEWLTVTTEDGTVEVTGDDGTTSTGYNGETVITVTAAALEGSEPRECDVVCYYDGAKFTIHVKQGEEQQQGIAGDVNNDGSVNAGDVSAVYNVMLGSTTDEDIIKRADVNGDESVNAGDVSAVYNIMLSGN